MRPHKLFRHLQTFVAIGTLLFVGNAHAANWFVRPSSQGSHTGTDWNDAWSLSSINWSSVKPGDTFWLAGGTYTTGLTVLSSGSSAARILIKRVTSRDSAATGAAGWDSSFDSQVIITGSPAIDIPNASYITIDGNQNAGSLMNNSRVYGIKCVCPKAGGSTILWGENFWTGTPVNVTDVAFKNIDLLGPYTTGPGQATEPSYGFQLAPYGSLRANLLIHDCRVAGYCESIREANWQNSVIEYCYIANEPAYSDLDHPDVALYYRGTNETWRYNVIVNSPVDGIAIGPDGYGPWYFYGNIYYNSYQTLIKLGDSPGTVGPVYIYNNVFATGPTNPWFATSPPAWLYPNGANYVAGSQICNNIFYNVANSFSPTTANMLNDYNAYNSDNKFTQPVPSEAHVVKFVGDPFVNSAAGDFHLTAAAAATFAGGIRLANDGHINVDIDGNQRGSPWYIGAYQYSGGTQAPAPATDLRIMAIH
jgi:hypothetical protein